MGSHTCAIDIHVLLEEIGKPYEVEKMDVAGGANEENWFKAINPKGKVPTLVADDGRVLTEFMPMAIWLARQNPDARLLPTDPDEEYRALSIADYAVGTIHGQGFGRIFKPARFEPQDPVHQGLGLGQGSVKRQGETLIVEAFDILDKKMAGHDWVAGNSFGVADAALFYVTRWAPQNGIELPSNLAAHLHRMKERPAVRRVMTVWGEE